jgi:DnaK suppressor protein
MKTSRAHTAPASNGAVNINVFRRMLEEKRQELHVTLGVKFDSIARAGGLSEEDQAQMTHDEYISLSRNKQNYQVLRLVNEALDRISMGDYGTCQRCEESISHRRLEVLPWAKYCVRCQERIAERADEEDSVPVLSHAW